MMLGALALLTIAIQGPVDVRLEPVLQKPLTLAFKEEPLWRVMKSIGAAVGAPVEAVNPLWDLKLVMLCKQETAGSMMAALASVLDCEWVKDGETYRLRIDKQRQDDLDAYVKAEDRLLRERVEQSLSAYAQLNPTSRSAPKAQPGANVDVRDADAQNIGQMFAGFTSADWNGFWRGEPQTWAPVSGGAPGQPPVSDEAKRIVVHYDPWIEFYEKAPSSGPTPTQLRKLVPFATPPEKLAQMPFAKRYTVWPGFGADAANDQRLKKSVQGISVKNGGAYTPLPKLSDQLSAFHLGTEIPVVSEVFSVPCVLSSPSGSGLSFLTQLDGAGARVKFDGEVLMARQNGFWRLRRFEVPEKLLSRFAGLSQEEPLSLASYVEFVSALTRPQASAVALEGALVLPFDPEPLHKMLPALWIYAQLSPGQRTRAHVGLSSDQLSPVQQRAFVEAMLLGTLRGRIPSYLGRAVSGDLKDLGVIVAEENFEGLKSKKSGRKLVGSRRFRIYLGSSNQGLPFIADARGPEMQP